MFKCYGDGRHPTVEAWRTGYRYGVRRNCSSPTKLIHFMHVIQQMFKCYGDGRHPTVEAWRTRYRYGVRRNCLSPTKLIHFVHVIQQKLCSDDIIIKVTIIAGSPTALRAHIYAFQTCILALAIPYASSLVTAAEHIYVKMLWSWQSSHDRGLKSWLWVWDSEQLIRSIETCMFYRNASNYHLTIVVTPTNARRGHMVFLIKLSIITDRDV